MDRKEFLKKACGSCAAISLGTFLASSLMDSCKVSSLALYKTSATDNMISLPVASFGESNFKLVRVNNYNYDVGVLKLKSGQYLALLLRCTHAGQAITKTGTGYFCPLHGSRFSPMGDVVKGPATSPLQHLPIKIDNQNLVIQLNAAYYSS